MKIKVKDGKPSLRSLYKVVAIGWMIGFGTLFGVFFLLTILISLLTGEMTINDEVVQGRGRVFLSMLPMIVLFPLVIMFHAFFFGALIIGGLALYRRKKPIELVDESGNSLIVTAFD